MKLMQYNRNLRYSYSNDSIMFITTKYQRWHYLECLSGNSLKCLYIKANLSCFYEAIIEIEALQRYFPFSRKIKHWTFIVGKSLWHETSIVFIFCDRSCLLHVIRNQAEFQGGFAKSSHLAKNIVIVVKLECNAQENAIVDRNIFSKITFLRLRKFSYGHNKNLLNFSGHSGLKDRRLWIVKRDMGRPATLSK